MTLEICVEPLEPNTDIVEEKLATATKRKRRTWLLAPCIGVTLLGVGLLALFFAISRTKVHTPPPRLTADDLEQQKYDARQKETEQLKAEQLRNDAFLIRNDEDTTVQLNNLMKDLKEDALPVPAADPKQTHAQEEAIAGVIRDPLSQPHPVSYESGRSHSLSAGGANAPNETPQGSPQPMFVYSRTFGGAKYVEQKESPRRIERPSKEVPPPLRPAFSEAAQKPQEPKDEKTRILYTDLPPVTLYEGELLDAILVNRIVADTEPSPVICQVSKDVFDSDGRYVVFPANSRIVGSSQVVNYKGAHRLFISFHRIILPNGPAVEFPGSQKALRALDETGALGAVSNVNRHWLLQFGTAIFFGVLDGLAGAAQRHSEIFSATSIVIDRTSRNFERILDTIMSQYASIVPTITVHQGHKMKIYLADDVFISPYARIKERSYATQ
jgi:type IV secretory pathway VirB10-like protein